jgi:hypothetical protein
MLDYEKFLEVTHYPPQKIILKGTKGYFKAVFKITDQETMEGYLNRIGILKDGEEDEENERKSKLVLRSIIDDVLIQFEDISIPTKIMDEISKDFPDEIKDDPKAKASAINEVVKKNILDKNIAVTHACWKSFQSIAMNDN